MNCNSIQKQLTISYDSFITLDHSQGHKYIFNKVKRIDIMHSMLLEHYKIKLEIDNRNIVDATHF